MRTVPMTRVGAVAAVAALLALAAPPAWSSPAEDNFLIGQPPPVDMAYLPSVTTTPPGGPPAPKNACIQVGSPQTVSARPWGQTDLHIEDAQRFATGAGVTVAVVDTGVTPNAYIKDRLSAGGDFVVASESGLKDCDGHGTQVAGIIAANTPPEVGFKGVAPGARLVSIRTNSANYGYETAEGFKPAGDVLTLATAIRIAADGGAKVINVSIAACFAPNAANRDDPTQKALQAAVHYARQQKDAVVVVAAGNYDQKNCKVQNDDLRKINTIASPAWYQGDVLTVGAIQADGTPAVFTLWGPWVDVAAPGTEIISLAPAAQGLVSLETTPTGQQMPIQGTSFAAPYVAGVVALVRERYPTLTATQVMERIKKTAQHPGGFGGRNNKVGYGMVNPIAALTSVIPEEHPGGTTTTAAPLRANLGQYKHTDSTPMLVAMFGSFSGIALVGLTLFVVHTVHRSRARQAQFARLEAARKRL